MAPWRLAAVYERWRFVELLERRLGRQPEAFEERPTGQSAVFYLAFDEHGRPVPETFMLGMAAWAHGIIETQGLSALDSSDACDIAGLQRRPMDYGDLPSSYSGVAGFDAQLDGLRHHLAWRLGHLPADQPVDRRWFADFVRTVVDKCSLTRLVVGEPVLRVKSVQQQRPRHESAEPRPKGTDDFLNSFFIKDLNRLLVHGLAKTGAGLRHFLQPDPHGMRHDVRKDRAKALELLRPQNFPEGCWPGEHPLVWSQQIAMNALWKDLGRASGIFAVNGPPGTGKTTLLRDVVAAVVVERARVLAARGASLLGHRQTIAVGKPIPYHPLDPALAGFSVVVASSNNGAVENVSLELPKKAAIHDAWSAAVDSYADIAGSLLGEPAWALIAGRLGNKTNRNEFASKFWWQKSADGKKAGKVPGLRERLLAIDEGTARPRLAWDDAVAGFDRALADERQWRERLTTLHDASTKLGSLGRELAAVRAEHLDATHERAVPQDELEALAERVGRADQAMDRLKRRIDVLRDTKPGWLDWLSTLGRSHREWRDDLRGAMNELQATEQDGADARSRSAAAGRALVRIDRRIVGLASRVGQLGDAITETAAELDRGRALLGPHWPDLALPEAEQERSSPWAHEEWRSARIRVFVAALNLHRAFVEANSRKMIANLGLAMDMLAGGITDPKTRALALDSLAIACPVISTTFASAASLFAELGPQGIGWLLIDEAGQATPQAAAGAIWRSRRVVAVGDPLQLEPVVTLPRSIEASLAACNGNVEGRWHPSRTSVQHLADQATSVGTLVGRGEDALWVGAPLRVHRRCDDPMFSISNAIAYDGLMVHQKELSPVSWPASVWLDVRKGSCAAGNWIAAEGEALGVLLDELLQKHHVPSEDIFLVSPFRDVVRELHAIGGARRLGGSRIGTVHTTQGKEAGVVILVLGGGTAGARNWAASKPNLLNVAVSRAKTRLYVIGERADWAKRTYFDVLAEAMPTGRRGTARCLANPRSSFRRR